MWRTWNISKVSTWFRYLLEKTPFNPRFDLHLNQFTSNEKRISYENSSVAFVQVVRNIRWKIDLKSWRCSVEIITSWINFVSFRLKPRLKLFPMVPSQNVPKNIVRLNNVRPNNNARDKSPLRQCILIEPCLQLLFPATWFSHQHKYAVLCENSMFRDKKPMQFCSN